MQQDSTFPIQPNATTLSPHDPQVRALPVTFEERRDENDDDEIDLRELWGVLLRRKGTIFTLAVLVFIATVVGTLMMTPIYRAGVTLKIDTEEQKILNYNVQSQTQPIGDTKDFYQTQYELLKSRTLARRTIDQLNLDAELRGEQLGKPFYSDMLDGIKQAIYGEDKPKKEIKKQGGAPLEDKFLKNLSVEPVKNSRIVTVSYDDPSPELAANVANALADNFIQMNLERRVNAGSYAKDFLTEQLALAKSKLEESETKLVAYAKKESIIRMDDEKQGSLASQKMGELNGELTKAEQERISAESKLQQALSSSGASKVLDNPTVQELKKNLAKLQGDYQEKLQIYKPGYPLMAQMESQITELQAQISQETGSITGTITDTLKADFQAAKQRETQLRSELTKQKDELLNLRDKSIGYNTLQREVETNRNLYEGLLQRIKEVGVAAGVGTNNISVVDPAIIPYAKHTPNVKLNLALGMVLGLFLGTVVAFLLEFLDDRVKTPQDLERLLKLPMLGLIPMAKIKDEKDLATLAQTQPQSALAEAFRSLRTNLLFATHEGVPKVLHITSALPSEGKSSTIINLAITFSQSGKKVLLVDADLRKPTLHKRLKLDNTQGLTNYLTNQAEFHALVQPTSLAGVYCLTSGPIPPNPAELLSGERLFDLAQRVPVEFDMILVDSPPVMGLADALVLSNRATATILVAAANQSKKRPLHDALERLLRARANLIGVVFTKVKSGKSYGYHYDYEYYYTYGTHDKHKKKIAKA